MHENSMLVMEWFIAKYLTPGQRILDVGSRLVKGSKPHTYRELFPPPFEYTGMDLEAGENVDIVGYENLPGAYDVVISGQVMEHLPRPWEWLKSLHPYWTELICIIAPHTFHEHRCPIDTFRYFPDGMRSLFEYAGIGEVEIRKFGVDTVGVGRKMDGV